MSSNEKYVPFGEEWIKEMMKWSKKDIIDFLREQLVARQNTKESPVNNTQHTIPAGPRAEICSDIMCDYCRGCIDGECESDIYCDRPNGFRGRKLLVS